MKLLYQIHDMPRAETIIQLLSDSGIETSLQGVHTWGIRSPRFVAPLTIWIVDDAKVARASRILEAFYASEISHDAKKDVAKRIGIPAWSWFLCALGFGLVLALLLISA